MDAPSTIDPIGATQMTPFGSVKRNSVNSVIVRPSGFHFVTGSPLKEPHLDPTESDCSTSEVGAGSLSDAHAAKTAMKAKNKND